MLICALVAILASQFLGARSQFSYVASDDYRQADIRAMYRGTWKGKDYDRWEKFHQAIEKILSTEGSVSMDFEPLPDFYHSGDWFDTYVDGFSIFNTKILSNDLLERLTACVSKFDPGATVEFVGIDGNVNGLNVLVTSEGAFVYWDGKTVSECKSEFSKLGVSVNRGQVMSKR